MNLRNLINLDNGLSPKLDIAFYVIIGLKILLICAVLGGCRTKEPETRLPVITRVLIEDVNNNPLALMREDSTWIINDCEGALEQILKLYQEDRKRDAAIIDTLRYELSVYHRVFKKS